MDLRNMLVVCGIMDLQNPVGNLLTQMFIYSKGFMVIDDFTMLRIKNAPNMIKYNNLVPNKEARLGAIQKCKLQSLVWWVKYCQNRGLEITAAAWTTAEIIISITKINIESP